MKKVLLIHGWNANNYYGRISTCAWNNRINFVKELEKHYEVYYPDLPGFGLNKEPNAKSWNVDNYAKYINDYIESNNLDIDFIIGYSFGAIVALRYKRLYNENIKEVLIAPALIRNYRKSRTFIKTPKFLNPLRRVVRDVYVSKVIKTKEMAYGTRFLRNTYQNIVRIDSINELMTFNPNDFTIIYGKFDDLVNPDVVLSRVNNEFKKRIILINGEHDIANTNTEELINIIKENYHE